VFSLAAPPERLQLLITPRVVASAVSELALTATKPITSVVRERGAGLVGVEPSNGAIVSLKAVDDLLRHEVEVS
jgi:hypothetical protein